MRVLLIHSRYSRLGGGESYVSSLRKLLLQEGNEVFFFSFDNDFQCKNKTEFVYKDHFNVNDHNPFRLLFNYILRFYFNPVLIVKLKKWIKDVNPEIIHIHANDRYGISVLLAVRGMGIPVMQSFHANDAVCLSHTFKKPDGRLCYNSLAFSCINQKCMTFSRFFAMVPSYMVKNQLTKRIVRQYATSNKILKERLENNGFKPVIYIPLFVWDNRYQADPELGTIFCPGSHLEQKGFQYLIKAMEYITQCSPGSKLHIAGAGPYSKELVKLAAETGMQDHIIFHGYLDTADLLIRYRKSSLVVFPSLFLEVSPLVILDAMASGRPIIGSSLSGIDEIFKETELGCLVDPTDPEQIARAACKVLNDKQLALKLGNNGRALFEREFNPDVHYKNLMHCYKSVITDYHEEKFK
jgi:glycosyltransferase involved in cell wall biosynthesis